MNIVHLNTFYAGGAGRAALQLHKALLERGENSEMLFVENIQFYHTPPNCYSISNLSLSGRIKKFLKKQNPVEQELISKLKELNVTNALLPFACYNVLTHPLVKRADVLHLHWINGMIDYLHFFRNCKKRIVWTLHDVNPVNGLFFTKDEPQLQNKEVMILNEKVFAIKKAAMNSVKVKMTITAPSKWLCDEAVNSSLLAQFDCIEIPNIVDLEQFRLQNKNDCRKVLGIPENETVFLFIAMSLDDHWKGFDLLVGALEMLLAENRDPIRLIVLGASNTLINDLPIHFPGQLKDNELLSKYYAAADAFVLPSRADNLPNVMLEAFASGLPVIAFPVGGIKEHVIDNYTGFLADEVTADALKKVLSKFLSTASSFKPAAIREYAETRFSGRKIANQFMQVYEEHSVA